MGVVPVFLGREGPLRSTNSPWTGCPPSSGLPGWLPALKHPPVRVGLIPHHGSITEITFNQGILFQGDLNPRCTQGGQNAGQSSYVPNPMRASPEGGLSMGEAQVILTRLEPSVLPGTAARKKSRILWNTEGEAPHEALRVLLICHRAVPGGFRGCGPLTIQSTPPHQML